MTGRNYFVPSMILFILFLILCIFIFTRGRKLSIFLVLIPMAIVVLLEANILKKNSKLETALVIIVFLAGAIMKGWSLKNNKK